MGSLLKYFVLTIILIPSLLYCQQQTGGGSGVSLNTVKQIASDTANVALDKAKTAIKDSLDANSRGFRTSAQAKQDAIDTLINIDESTLSSDADDFMLFIKSGQVKKIKMTNLQIYNELLDSIRQLRADMGGYTPTYPNPVENLVLSRGNGQVILSWTVPTQSDSVQIERASSLTGGTVFTTIGYTTSTTYLDSGLTNGVTYTYRLRNYYNQFASSPATESTTPNSIWFVDKNANGYGSGRTWKNAWTSFASINWNNIQAGDTVYISGGTDSVIYGEKLTIDKKNGTPSQYIVVTKGKDTNHDGKVIINGGYTISEVVSILGCQYLKFSKIKVTYGSIVVYKSLDGTQGSKNVIIDSVDIYNHSGAGIALSGYPTVGLVDSVYITNSRIVRDSTYNYQTDQISFGWATNTFIRNNYFYLYNNSDGHNDNIQAYQVNYNAEISGNYIEHIQPTNPVAGWADNMIFLNYVRGKVLIFNNILNYKTCTGTFNVVFHGVDGLANFGESHLYNNTFIGGLSHTNVVGIGAGTSSQADSIYVKNNIITSTRSDNTNLYWYDPNYFSVSQFNYNLFYNPNSNRLYTLNGVGYNLTLTQLQNAGAELNSYFADPLFVDYDNGDYRLRANSPARNAGVNLSQYFNTDKDGTSRPQEGAWDIGAFEYVP